MNSSRVTIEQIEFLKTGFLAVFQKLFKILTFRLLFLMQNFIIASEATDETEGCLLLMHMGGRATAQNL